MSGHIDLQTIQKIRERIRLCDYLAVAQLYLQDNFLLEEPLSAADTKPRLLGHWGTCHGINVAYANFKSYFGHENFSFILGTVFPRCKQIYSWMASCKQSIPKLA